MKINGKGILAALAGVALTVVGVRSLTKKKDDYATIDSDDCYEADENYEAESVDEEETDVE